MPIVRLSVPLYVPAWFYGPLRRVKRALFPAPPANGLAFNPWGERQAEWAFINANLGNGPGDLLDFGCEHGYLSLVAARRGFRVTAVDLQPQTFAWNEPNIHFVQGDLLELPLPEEHFDVIVNCSSVEHVGVAGRYGIRADQDEADLRAMQRMRSILKLGGKLLMTAPCGRDAVFAPLHRIYGRQRLPRLLDGFAIESESFLARDARGQWVACDKQAALDLEARADFHNPVNSVNALGLFVLQRPAN